jgi:hypothetical protein
VGESCDLKTNTGAAPPRYPARATKLKKNENKKFDFRDFSTDRAEQRCYCTTKVCFIDRWQLSSG